MVYVGERIAVLATFGGERKLKPLKFKWSNNTVEIKEITYFWQDREGDARVYHFSVTDGCAVYELSFNSLSIVWTLEKVEA
ncbi:hypothetical protein [Candidatus Magnetomonas plexicatena]|uniref:hypothetical protein n=1 Tax=Candidatus Magnetomonas plexicatena TaxID=2552947 RepID=UPI001C78E779|nr:hypothetical protein E2O03_009205 [Nitrospirales bacterium LBB_01]